MRAFRFVVAAILAVGLLLAIDRPSTRTPVAPPTGAAQLVSPAGSIGLRKATSSIAAYPDRGQLLADDHVRRVVRSGASTWHPVQISEAHALRAIAEGAMTLRAPNGELIRLRYERHFEHPDGNWTWVGREDGSAPGTETVLTFGDKAVFGTIRQANADLSLTTEAGSTWLVETDHSRADRNRLAANDEEFPTPAGMPAPVAMNAPEPVQAASGSVRVASMSAAAAAAPTPTTVDIAMGFTTGFATRLGGESQARTRLNFLVDVTNQAFLASGIDAQIRLVHALQVDYPDATPSRSALFDLTAVECTTQTSGSHYLSDRRVDCTPIAQPAGLVPLTAARDAFSADLLVLVRKYEDPEQVSCGSAWMLGGGQNPIDAGSAAFGTTVVSDTSGDMFPDNGNTCSEVQLAHELGHNFGQQHDLVTASGDDDSDNNGSLLDPDEYGYHAYSFGYSTDGTGSDISTIMSNRRPSQTRYRVFANPRIASCGGAPCGDREHADNARSMLQTMPLVAQFRVIPPTEEAFDLMSCDAGRFDFNGDAVSDLLWRNQANGGNAIWNSAMSGQGQAITAVPSPLWQVAAVGDFTGDGVSDVIWRHATSGWNVIWPSANSQLARDLTTVPSQVWRIVGVGDFNADGRSDLLWRHMQDGWNLVWLSGNSTTTLGLSPVPSQLWRVAAVADFNGDSKADILWRHAREGWNTIWLGGQSVTTMAVGPMSKDWRLAATGDFTGDARADLVWRNSRDGSNVLWPSAQSVSSRELMAVPSSMWQIAGVGDFNADGRLDLLWRQNVDGWNVLWPSANAELVRDIAPMQPQSWQTAGMCRQDAFVLPL